MRTLTLLFCGIAASSLPAATHALLDRCEQDGTVLTQIADTDSVRIVSALNLGVNCYSVVAKTGTGELHGYLLEATHPDVVRFESERRKAASVVAPPPPPPPVAPIEEDPAPQPQPSLEARRGAYPRIARLPDLRGHDVMGGVSSLASKRGDQLTVVVFWKPGSALSTAKLRSLGNDFADFSKRGFNIFLVSLDHNKKRVEQTIHSEELYYPNLIDDGVAAKLGVTEADLPRVFIVDRNLRVVLQDPSHQEWDRLKKARFPRERPLFQR